MIASTPGMIVLIFLAIGADPNHLTVSQEVDEPIESVRHDVREPLNNDVHSTNDFEFLKDYKTVTNSNELNFSLTPNLNDEIESASPTRSDIQQISPTSISAVIIPPSTAAHSDVSICNNCDRISTALDSDTKTNSYLFYETENYVSSLIVPSLPLESSESDRTFTSAPLESYDASPHYYYPSVISSTGAEKSSDYAPPISKYYIQNVGELYTIDYSSVNPSFSLPESPVSSSDEITDDSVITMFEYSVIHTSFVDEMPLSSMAEMIIATGSIGNIIDDSSTEEGIIRPTVVVRSADMSSSTYVPWGIGPRYEDKKQKIQSVDRSGQLRDLPVLNLSAKVHDDDSLKKDTRQSNPSIEQLISGLVNLLGGNVKTDKQYPKPPRIPIRRPVRPFQPRPSLVKIPSFITSSRLNNRGPSKFSGVRPGVNIGVPTRPVNTRYKPTPTVPSVFFSTKSKPNLWEWPNFADKSSQSSKHSINTLVDDETEMSTPPVKVTQQTSSGVSSPKINSSDAASIWSLPTPLLTSSSEVTSSPSSVTELIITFEPGLSKQSKTSTKPIIPSITDKVEPTTIWQRPEDTIDSTRSTVQDKVELKKSKVSTLSKPMSTIEIMTTTDITVTTVPEILPSPSSVLVGENYENSDIQSPLDKTKSIEGSVSSKINPSTETVSVASESAMYNEPSIVQTTRKEYENEMSGTSTPTSEVAIITAPSIIQVTVKNSFSRHSFATPSVIATSTSSVVRLKPAKSPEKSIINTNSQQESTKPTPLLPTVSTPNNYVSNPTEKPKPFPVNDDDIITLSGHGTYKPVLPKIQPKPPYPKHPPHPSRTKRPKPSRPSSVGKPTVIPVEIDQFREKKRPIITSNRDRFSNRRPGSGNTQVVGAGISFGSNAGGLRPVRPRPTRPRPKHKFGNDLPPIRIDTCVVGEDSTCDTSLNEQCRTEQGVSSCICRPGFARTGSRGPCFSVVSLVVSIKIDRVGNRKISFNKKLLDKKSEQYKILKDEAAKALTTSFKYSKFRQMYFGSAINKFYSQGGKVIMNATVMLEKNPQTTTESVRRVLQRDLIQVITSRNQNIGDSILYVEGPLNPIPGVQDLNECDEPELNDCGENADCENMFGSFKCKCKSGYLDKYPNDQWKGGRQCTTCSASFCNNHGDCVINNGVKECICHGSYVGARCDMDGEVLGVAIGASLAAVFIIVLTLVCLCSWSRRWKKEEQKIDRASARTTSSGNTFTYIDKSGNAVGSSYHLGMDDRGRWPQIANSLHNYYASDPVLGPPPAHPTGYSNIYPTMQSKNGTVPCIPKTNQIPDHQYHVPRPRSRASHSENGLYFDPDFSPRDTYNPNRNSGYAIPLRPMRS